jgi:alkaline phosphatase D
MLTRRQFSGLVGGATLAGTSIAVLGKDASLQFQHGVASGDPLTDRVILWTRISGYDKATEVTWEIARDAGFRNIVRRGVALTGPERDFTVKVDADQLQPGQRYHYRFRLDGVTSPVGRTATAADRALEALRMAIVSCSNYPAGYFNVYRAVALRDDIDVVVHLGDYIYEYGQDGYASTQAAAMGRLVEPAHEILALNDYRQRHALYKSDPDLQLAHARHPFIAIWDDHEIANDAWTHGAQNHDESEGDYLQRRDAAMQAYYEWMPVRAPEDRPLYANYRSFQFGDLATLAVIETRLTAREEQLDLRGHLEDVEHFRKEVLAKRDAALVGETQFAWLETAFDASRVRGTTWQVLGNQVMVAEIATPDFSKMLTTEQIHQLMPEVQALIPLTQLDVPLLMDVWDGYPRERERLYRLLDERGVNNLVLTGDIHSAWGNRLVNEAGRQVGFEVVTSSVTSPGFSDYFGIDGQLMASAFRERNPHIEYAQLSDRGYALLTLTHERASAEWLFVDTVKDRNFTSSREQSLIIPAAR